MMSNHNHEQVVFCNEPDIGLKAIIAIHNTTLGPSLGGCRFYPYNTDEEGLNDVLRLSRGMTYKASIAGLNLGDGKSVIIGNPDTDRNEFLFRAFKQAEGIYDTLMEIFKMSADEGIPTNVASDRLAENRIRSVAKLKTFYTSTPRLVFKRG